MKVLEAEAYIHVQRARQKMRCTWVTKARDRPATRAQTVGMSPKKVDLRRHRNCWYQPFELLSREWDSDRWVK
eukprot:2575023-Pleurochrysis_carterae.AAC.1